MDSQPAIRDAIKPGSRATNWIVTRGSAAGLVLPVSALLSQPSLCEPDTWCCRRARSTQYSACCYSTA